MTKQIKHTRQMRNERYKKPFDYFKAGSRTNRIFLEKVEKGSEEASYPTTKYEKLEKKDFQGIAKLRKEEENADVRQKYLHLNEHQLKARIYTLLYDTTKLQGLQTANPKLLRIVVVRDEATRFDFLRAGTIWKSVGKWEETTPEKNILIEVQFKDNNEGDVSEHLNELLKVYNRKYIKEQVLFVQIIPIEATSL
jgi:hypothetical protein